MAFPTPIVRSSTYPMAYSSPLFSDGGRILTKILPDTFASNIWDNYFENYGVYSWLILWTGLLTSAVMLIKLNNQRLTLKNILIANYTFIFQKIKIIRINRDNLNLFRVEIIIFSTKLFLFFFTTYYANLMNTSLVSQDLSIYVNNLEQLYDSATIDPFMTEDDPLANQFRECSKESIFYKIWLKGIRKSRIHKSGPKSGEKLARDLSHGKVGLLGSETYLHIISHSFCVKNRTYKFWISNEKFLHLNWAFGYSKTLDPKKKFILDSWWVLLNIMKLTINWPNLAELD